MVTSNGSTSAKSRWKTTATAACGFAVVAGVTVGVGVNGAGAGVPATGPVGSVLPRPSETTTPTATTTANAAPPVRAGQNHFGRPGFAGAARFVLPLSRLSVAVTVLGWVSMTASGLSQGASASITAAGVWYRSAGFFAIILAITSLSSA